MHELMTPIVVVVSVLAIVFVMWHLHQPSKPKPWEGEFRIEDNELSMETCILDSLEKRITSLNRSVWFSTLLSECKQSNNFDPNEFWNTLLRLESEGKVVRVSDATTEHDSLWALPAAEEE